MLKWILALRTRCASDPVLPPRSSTARSGLLTKVLALAGELPPRRIALEVNRLLWKPRM
jgi:hypothetical protein